MDFIGIKHYIMCWALAVVLIITYRCVRRKLEPLSSSTIDYGRLEHFGYLRMITIVFLVCLFSCIEFNKDFDEVEVNINPWKILQTFLYTFLVIIGIDIETAIFLIPWCTHCTVNLIIEGKWIMFFIRTTYKESIFPFKSMIWTLYLILWFIKIKWWNDLLGFYCLYAWSPVYTRWQETRNKMKRVMFKKPVLKIHVKFWWINL